MPQTNILISQDGTPMLMDFGMASLEDVIPQTNPRPKSSLRWTPLEIYEGKVTHTMHGDIYSLGMTILEAFTSQVPFADLTDNLLVMHVAVSRNIPSRPEAIPTNTIDGDRLWAILIKCWSYNPKHRPSAEEVRSEIAPERAENLTLANRTISEEARSETLCITAEGPVTTEHPRTEVDRSKSKYWRRSGRGKFYVTNKSQDPLTFCGFGMQAITAGNQDTVDHPTTEEVRSEAETIRPERRRKIGGKWRKWFSRKKKSGQ
ncbi:unnamed protein product [Rhizoctonia solani]|uniref:Protein kinase domain-containing protein n=1 Tax=Rhizoctonia solani TaxID=456999 RepID=A0A8H3E1K0_9AGAM|nr:unnamed protein product [Rhizoctonia solani]